MLILRRIKYKNYTLLYVNNCSKSINFYPWVQIYFYEFWLLFYIDCATVLFSSFISTDGDKFIRVCKWRLQRAQICESNFNNNLIECCLRLLRTNEPCLSDRRHYAQPNYRPMISWNAIRNSIDEMLVWLPNHRRIKRSRCRSLSIYIFNAKDLLWVMSDIRTTPTGTLYIFSCKILFAECVQLNRPI